MGETWIDIVGTEHDTRPMVEQPSTNVRFVSPGYFQTLRVGLRDGRDFEEQDRNRMVCIISTSLAQRLWGKENPVGRKLRGNGSLVEVVGVTPDFRSTSLEKDPVNMLYIPYWQRSRLGAALLVRTSMDPRSIANALRTAIWEIDSEVTVPEVRTLEEVLSRSVAERRFQMLLVALFAAGALALAAFGTYGVLSYAVSRRSGEMGIRMALGAQRSDVLGMILRQGMTPVLVGLAGGAATAAAIGRYLESLLSPRSAGLRGLGSGPAGRFGGRLPDSRAPRHPRQPHGSPALRVMPAGDRMRLRCHLSSRTSSSRTSLPPAWTTCSTGRANRPSGR
jgi:ABC-type antimicrobial peptide transport system permease subunit